MASTPPHALSLPPFPRPTSCAVAAALQGTIDRAKGEALIAKLQGMVESEWLWPGGG
jgi:hypothetical protein